MFALLKVSEHLEFSLKASIKSVGDSTGNKVRLFMERENALINTLVLIEASCLLVCIFQETIAQLKTDACTLAVVEIFN